MATNPYVNFQTPANEQALIDSLTVEFIKFNGLDVFYVPRRLFTEDDLFNEDTQSYFDTAIPIEMYLLNAEKFQGQGNLLTQFGLEIRDQVTFVVAVTTFQQLVAEVEDFTRPREGDLVYFPFNKKCYEITYVEKFPLLYPLGKLYTYELNCELFQYSSQKFTTGIIELDGVQALSQDLYDWALRTEDDFVLLAEDGAPLLVEEHDEDTIDPADETTEVQTEGNTFIDFSEADPYSEGLF